MALNILARTKEYLKIEASDTQYDSILNNLIVDVSITIRNIANQPIEQIGEYVRQLIKTEDPNIILLPYTVPIVVLKIEYTEPFKDTYTTLPTTEYEVYYEGYVQKIWFRGGIDENYTWRISISAGYLDADMPEDILGVGVEMASLKFTESTVGDGRLGKRSIGTSMSGTGTTTTYKDMLPEWKNRLSRYIIYSL